MGSIADWYWYVPPHLNYWGQGSPSWLVEECRGLGCDIKIDQMGNVFATRPGIAKDRNAIAMGSHMDTQPTGGRCASYLCITTTALTSI